MWKVDFIMLLPLELAHEVLSYLSPKIVCILALVSKAWETVCSDGTLWCRLFKRLKWRGVSITQTSTTWKAAFLSHRLNFPTITKAMNSPELRDGDTVYIQAGTYLEGITISRPLTLIGETPPAEGDLEQKAAQVVIVRASNKSALSFRTSSATVKNIKFEQTDDGKFFCVHINQGKLVMEDCEIVSQSLACVAVTGNKASPVLRCNTIHDSASVGVIFFDYGEGVLENNDIFNIGLSGVEIGKRANPTLVGNSIHHCNSAGVVVNGGKGVLESNNIYANCRSGIKIKGGGNPIIRHNNIHDGKQRGLLIVENSLGIIQENEIYGNCRSGIKISTMANPLIQRNQIHDGSSAGVMIHNGGKGVLEDNDIYKNNLSGIEVRKRGCPRVQRNRIYSGNGAGLYVHSGGMGTFEENEIFDNLRQGIKLRNPGPIKMSDNRTHGNINRKELSQLTGESGED
eukprot:TRINITY_DN401_c0_g1_i3.p1 TRINITY_DN401_c0_g1~~TRINITY_DN401_c0_g1_i3.p1  ORF type:complete len:457 (-),score=54.79 TRINITY_DN401_c0_g1_i3:132-1502(-)